MTAYDREDHVQWGTLAELVGVPIRCCRLGRRRHLRRAVRLVGGRPGDRNRVAGEPRLPELGSGGVRLVSVTNPGRVQELAGATSSCGRTPGSWPSWAAWRPPASYGSARERRSPFGQGVDALARVEEGHGPGKVVVLSG